MSNISYQKAIELLHIVASPEGFLGSEEAIANYKRVWTRDAVIDGLAALRREMNNSSIVSKLRWRQFSCINIHRIYPSNVDIYSKKASFGGTVGRADAIPWAIIGLCNFAHSLGNYNILHRFRPQVEKGLAVLDVWEYNGRGLVYVPQSGDWGR